MSRFLSLRSMRTNARSAVLCLLSVVLLCLSAPQSFSQTYDDKDDKYAGADIGDPLDSGYSGTPGTQQAAVLSNVGSGITRPSGFSSVGAVQALLYGDAVSVIHFNFGKIDYEGLSTFVDELVDKGAGSVRSDDKYRVDLREYQKKQLKSSFKNFLSVVQNAVVKNMFQNNLDEIYHINYASDDNKVLGSSIVAFPTAGLSEADVKAAINSISETFEPYSIFVRYGFIIAVIEHDAAKPFDSSEIDARFQAKILQSQNRAYGSYSASGRNGAAGGMNNGYGATPSPLGGSGMEASDRSSQSVMLRDYQNEIQEAKERNRTESRRETLPRIRNRFAKPATEEESAPFMRGLSLADGAAISMVAKDVGELTSLLNNMFQNNLDESVKGSVQGSPSPFAGLGAGKTAEKSSDSDETIAAIREAFDEQSAESDVKSLALALSLVGSPRVVAFLGFDDEEAAKKGAKSLETALKVVRPIVAAAIQDQIAQSNVDAKSVDLSPVINAVFDELAPRVSNADLAVVLNLEPIKTNAALFMPLLGGVETKSQQEMESDTIDWSLGDSDAGKVDSDAEIDEESLFDDDSDVDNASDSSSGDENDEEEEEEEEEEEDPFA